MFTHLLARSACPEVSEIKNELALVELVKILLQLRLAESFNVGNMVCFGTLNLPHKATLNMAPIDDEDDEVP